MLSLGIDPGLKNTGITLIDENKKIVKTDLSKGDIDILIKLFDKYSAPDIVVIERYVQYSHHQTDHEKINRLIGGLEVYFKYIKNPNVTLLLPKAVEWQYYLRKVLKHKKDKSYKRLAKKIFNIELPTEHQSDGFFLALYGLLKKKEHNTCS